MTNITNEWLVKDYLDGLTIDEIARKYGVSLAAIYGRLKTLRDAGVKLPPRRRIEAIDVNHLNSVIENYREKDSNRL